MFNFFLKKQIDSKRTNTLDEKGSNQEIIDTFLTFAKETTQARQKNFQQLISFALESEQWTNSELNEKNDLEDRALTFNFSNEYIERYMARLFPRNPQTGIMDLGVKAYSTDKQSKQKLEEEILFCYKKHDIQSILLEQGLNFLAGGAACLYYPQDLITKRGTIESINPADCYLGWKNGKLVQFAFQTYLGDNKYSVVYWDLQRQLIKDENDNITEFKNKYGLIPFSWIPNFPKPHSHEGNPKTNLLYGLDREYNAQSSNFSKRIAENTDPHLVLMSDTCDLNKIERGRNKKTRIGSNDKLAYLELKEGDEIVNWLSVIERRITNKTGIVNTTGDVKTNISGKSLSFQYSDMMDLIGFMRIHWDKAIREMNKTILTYKYGINDYETDPVYQPFLQQDNSERIDQYAKMIDNDLISHLDAIDELRGVENAEDKLNEIIAEKEKFNKLNTKQDEQRPISNV